ncbi:MAG TPA: hypothetical protein VMD28_06685 [Acidimicrobiales bacterium]|nr:hypothetical protein [Acidimicrobiales bacterium]
MSEHACPGTCNARYRDALEEYAAALQDYDPLDSATSRPEPPSIQPWPGEPVWCSNCSPKITVKLAELDDLAALLAATADGHRHADAAERVSGSPEPPSASPEHDDLDDLSTMLGGWESAYRDLRGWPSPPRRGDLASTMTTCIAWLGSHLRGILASDIGADFGREVLQWHRETAARAKAGVRTLRKPLRCPTCGMLTLFWTEGETNVYCADPNCARVLSLPDYENEVERITADATRRAA